MRSICVWGLFVCATFAVSARGQGQQSQVGTWKMDAAQSNMGSGPASRSVTLTILQDAPSMLSWRVQFVDDSGKSMSFSWSGPQDGSMHSVMLNGKEFRKESTKKQADGTLLRHGEFPNGTSFDAYSRTSVDGNTMTDDITVRANDGKESKQKVVYHRVMGNSGVGK